MCLVDCHPSQLVRELGRLFNLWAANKRSINVCCIANILVELRILAVHVELCQAPNDLTIV